MALITTIGGPTSNSYGTAVQAAEYVTRVYGATSWSGLSSDAVEVRLKLAALIMNTLKYRGMKACMEQNLAFPRWSPTSDVYLKYKRYLKYDADSDFPWYEDLAPADMSIGSGAFLFKQYSQIAASGYPLPLIETDIQEAQFEIAYQVVHSNLLTMGPLQVPSGAISAFGLGGSLEITFASSSGNGTSRSVFFDTSRMDSTAIIELKLHKWLRRFSGGVV